MLHLVGGGLEVVFAAEAGFFRAGLANDAAGAVEAGVVDVDDGVALNDGAVDVDVRYVDAAEVGDRAVVGEDSAAPLTAEEADAAVAEAVVDAAIEADMRTPVAGVPSVESAGITPVARGPEKADRGRLHPDAGNPVIAGVAIGPVAGGPHVAGGGQRWLHIDGQRGRCKVDRDKNAGVGLRCRQSEQRRRNGGGKKQLAKCGAESHGVFSFGRDAGRLILLSSRVHLVISMEHWIEMHVAEKVLPARISLFNKT